MVRLGEVCNIVGGYAFKSDKFTKDGVPVIRISNLDGDKVFVDDSVCYDEQFWNSNIEYRINKNDILMAMSGATVGKIGLYAEDDKALLNQRVCNIKPIENKIDREFLYFYCKSEYFMNQIQKNAFGCAQPNISIKQLLDFNIRLGTIKFQKDVAEKIAAIFRLIEKRKQQLQKLDELVKARFVEMFGDLELGTCNCSVLKLKDLSHKISDGVHAKPNYTSYGKPFLSVVNINRRKVDFTDCKYVSEEDYEKMIKSTHPQKGDVLYTKVGATYGIPAFVDTDEEFCLYVSVCLIKPVYEKINSRFLAIQMDMPFVKHQADKRIKGIGVPDLHLNQIREFDIICPVREQQNQFVEFVQQIDKSKLEVQKSLDKLQTLKKALMQKYFG